MTKRTKSFYVFNELIIFNFAWKEKVMVAGTEETTKTFITYNFYTCAINTFYKALQE